MEPYAANILSEIEAVFPSRRVARFNPMVDSVQGEEPLLTNEAFADKDDWTKLDSKWLDEAPAGWATALSFLSNDAVCFYVPAFIAADLRGELQRADPMFNLSHCFANLRRDERLDSWSPATWYDYGEQRWSHLTCEQARAIVHYLEWRIEKDGLEFAYDASEALSAFWYNRATRPSTGS